MTLPSRQVKEFEWNFKLDLLRVFDESTLTFYYIYLVLKCHIAQ